MTTTIYKTINFLKHQMSQRGYYTQQYFIDNNEACRRRGEAYKKLLDLERILSLSLCRWFKAIAISRNSPREYVFLNLIPTIGAMMGARASKKVFQKYLEKSKLFMLILGKPGAGNIISSF